MKKFVLKGILFYMIIFGACALFLVCSAKDPTRAVITRWMNSEEYAAESGILPVFERAKGDDDTRQLVIGDSICNQLFSGLWQENPETEILGTNAAFMITGQYLLAEEYLDHHPETTDVFLIMHPLAITRTFDMEWSYRYSVMPCAEVGVLQKLDGKTLDEMAGVYGRLFLREDVIAFLEESPFAKKIYLNYIYLNSKPYEQKGSFEIADRYVKKLYDLCAARGVELHLYASPVAEFYREQMAELEKEYRDTWMCSQYPNYFSDIMFYPDEWSGDLSHFEGEHAQRESLDKIIETAYEGSVLLEKVKVSK